MSNSIQKENFCFSYEFFELHWHWGSLSTQGSEHTLDGRKYPAELHVSLFNKKYDGVTTALGNSDGLASLAFLFEVGMTQLIPITKLIRGKITKPILGF